MVTPRSFSSGALSIISKDMNWANPFEARCFVIAAVNVVLPWSTCPMVPILTCGFVLSNFFFAISSYLLTFRIMIDVELLGPVPQFFFFSMMSRARSSDTVA